MMRIIRKGMSRKERRVETRWFIASILTMSLISVVQSGSCGMSEYS